MKRLATLHISSLPGLTRILTRHRIILSLATLLLLNGCGNPAAAGNRLFTSEPFKGEWEGAISAMHTNGYVAAVRSLRRLQGQPLNTDQLNAVYDELRDINAQMFRELSKGDVNASNAFAELRKDSGR